MNILSIVRKSRLLIRRPSTNKKNVNEYIDGRSLADGYGELECRVLSKLIYFGLSGFQHNDQNSPFSLNGPPQVEVLLEPLIEKFKLVVGEKYESENLDVNIDDVFSLSRIRIPEKNLRRGLTARLAVRVYQETRKSCRRLLGETSVLHGIDINLSF